MSCWIFFLFLCHPFSFRGKGLNSVRQQLRLKIVCVSYVLDVCTYIWNAFLHTRKFIFFVENLFIILHVVKNIYIADKTV